MISPPCTTLGFAAWERASISHNVIQTALSNLRGTLWANPRILSSLGVGPQLDGAVTLKIFEARSKRLKQLNHSQGVYSVLHLLLVSILHCPTAGLISPCMASCTHDWSSDELAVDLHIMHFNNTKDSFDTTVVHGEREPHMWWIYWGMKLIVVMLKLPHSYWLLLFYQGLY